MKRRKRRRGRRKMIWARAEKERGAEGRGSGQEKQEKE
jgi:hypothetical protein